MESSSLSEILYNLKDEVYCAFPDSFWVRAEVSECRENQSGHCYLELIEKDENERIIAKSRASIWAQVYRLLKPYFEGETGLILQPGMKILVQANFEFHEVYGFSMNITDIEPSFTVGDIALKRDKIIKRLTEEGVVDMNKMLDVPIVPRRIAIVSSGTAAGYGDFMNQLNNNRFGYTFSCTLFTAKMQGEQTTESVIEALDNIASQIDDFDVVAIIRGGGATSELSAFDSYELAYYCTQFPLPILSGIGHQRDVSVIDAVANQSLKTPTAVADFLIDSVRDYEDTLSDLLLRAVRLVQEKIDRQEDLLLQYKMRLVQLPQKIMTLKMRQLDALWLTFQSSVRRSLDAKKQDLLLLQQRIAFCSPDECLSRGYVRVFGKNGWIKSVADLREGDEVKMQFADGEKSATIK